ncbi:MAG: SufD family Fe-S cluster assembly protein [Sulfolobales archaeon]
MSKKEIIEDIIARAKQAINKPAIYGADLDIETILKEKPVETKIDTEKISELGLDLSEKSSSALYLQVDSLVKSYKKISPEVEIMSIEEAVDTKWDEVKDYFWRLIDPATDKYVAYTALRGVGGFYVRVKRNSKVQMPIQACMMSRGGAQLLHNIIILEENSEATILSGCLAAIEKLNLHVGVSEIYMEPGSKLTSVMIHSWTNVSHVRPRTKILMKDNTTLIDYYINMSDTKTLQSYPVIISEGSNNSIMSTSIILGSGDSYYDIGAGIVLHGDNSSAQLISRTVARDDSKVINRLSIESRGRGNKAYIECSGLLLSKNSSITTIPELNAKNPESDLYHEASIGRIRDDEIDYLISKGISYREAIALLIRGFIETDIKIPNKILENYIKNILDLFASKSST